MATYCGVDFGTSNSVISLIGDDETPATTVRAPSIMYFPETGETTVERYCGNEAVDRYVHGGMRGRFFQSVKTLLPDAGFTGTAINGKRFSAEDLVAVMLRFLRSQIRQRSGVDVRNAVFGRPAKFSDRPSDDDLAQTRLEAAAHQAGFETIAFEFEPVAGAHAFRSVIRVGSGRDTWTTFVSDHGGGTSDFTIMRVAFEPGQPLPVRSEILATHGVRVGGDDFDSDIMWRKLVRHFGYGSEYESWGKLLPVPVHIYRTLCRWDRIHLLKTISYRDELRYFRNGSTDPVAIDRLISLIEDDIGYFLFQAIERAKISLSESDSSAITFRRDLIELDEPITAREFTEAIRERVDTLRHAIGTTLALAGIASDEIDQVFVTGGSSRVPAIGELLRSVFSPERVVQDVDQFNSVGIGLSLVARERAIAS